MTVKPKAEANVKAAPRFVWQPEDIVIRRAIVPAAAGTEEFHGSPGQPGYNDLHPGKGGHGDLVTDGNKIDKGDPLTYYRVDTADAPDPDQAEADEELQAVYSSDGYSDPMSGYLRTGASDPDEIFSDSELNDMRDAMDRMAERHTLAEPVSLYRIAPASIYDQKDGNRVVDDAFMSTTVFKGVTEHYRTNPDDVIIRIDMPAGAHIIPHRHLNKSGSAKGEVIVPRGLPLEQVTKEDGVIVYKPVMTDKGAETVTQDDTSSELDNSVAGSAATITAYDLTEQGGPMPWHKVQNHSGCSADKPWAVVKDSDGSVAGCHASEGDADSQLAALYANEGKATTVAEELGGKPNEGTKKDKRLKPNKMAEEPVETEEDKPLTLGEMVEQQLAAKAAADTAPDSTAPWKGPLAVEGKVTGDGREFADGALDWAEPPLPLRWNKEDSHGGEPHTVAVNVGRIDRLWRENGMIMGEGALNLAETDGQRVHDMIKGGFIRGVSIDADSISDAQIEYVMPEDTPTGDDADLFDLLMTQPEKIVFHGGRIRAATLCDIPAFAEAYIALTDAEGAIVAGGTPTDKVQAHAVYARTIDGLIAHGGPEWKPPAEWFSDPKLSVPTGIQVDDNGRIYGHAAMWGACHIGQSDVCIQPPHEDQHPYYMTGETVTAEGSRVAVGQITVGTGHASLSLGAQPAAEHYDHTGHAVADVAVGNDAHGIWVAGAIRPGADPLLVHELRASGQVSGDWRRIGGKMRMVGLLAVNIPGFPVPRTRALVSGGSQVALVAAGRPTVSHGKTEKEIVQQAFRMVMNTMAGIVHEGRD